MVILTTHYKKRFFQRQAKTKRIGWFTQRAFDCGYELCDLKYGKYDYLLEGKEKIFGSTAKIYKGFIYWFVGNRAITIYPLPSKVRGDGDCVK